VSTPLSDYLVLGAILLVLWFAAVVVFIRADAWPPR